MKRLTAMRDRAGWLDNMALEDSRRRLAAKGAEPQHCSQAAVPAGACEGAHVVTKKQRNLIELYSALTMTPAPDVEAWFGNNKTQAGPINTFCVCSCFASS